VGSWKARTPPGRTNRVKERRHGSRVGKKHQDETTDGRVEGFVTVDLVHVGLGEADVPQSSLSCASVGPCNRGGIAFYAHYRSRGTNDSGQQHGHISHAGAEIEDSLARTNARLTQ
jgi:hypothetical protein